MQLVVFGFAGVREFGWLVDFLFHFTCVNACCPRTNICCTRCDVVDASLALALSRDRRVTALHKRYSYTADALTNFVAHNTRPSRPTSRQDHALIPAEAKPILFELRAQAGGDACAQARVECSTDREPRAAPAP
jgi:hypothetical protein